MTLRQTTLSIPEFGPATLTLPVRLTPESLGRLEAAIERLLRKMRRDLSASAADDPGSVEVDSWLVQPH